MRNQYIKSFIGINRSILFFGVFLTIWSCQYEFPEKPKDIKDDLGEIDFNNPVFLGGTQFSGVSNGAISTSSSSSSIPQILLNKIHGLESSSSYPSPAVSSENGFNIYENSSFNSSVGQYRLIYPSLDTGDFTTVLTEGDPFQYINPNGTLSNFSFPQTQILDFTESNRIQNPYLQAFYSSLSQSILKSIEEMSPSFFLLNLGYEDILAYASNGAEGQSNVSNPETHSFGDLISEELFEQKLTETVEGLLASNPNAKGLLMNIPDFLKFPFFTEVKFDITPYIQGTPLYNLTVQAAAQYNTQLDNYYQQNPNIPYWERRPYLDFASDRAFNWGIIVTDKDLDEAYGYTGEPLPKIRHAHRKDLIFLPLETVLNKSKGHFYTNALTEKEYLKEVEAQLISSKINSFNQIIESVSSRYNGRISVVDMFSYFQQMYEGFDPFLNRRADGKEINGVLFYPGIEKFGIFSADGLNLNPRGNALIVNLIIEELNNSFGAEIQPVDPNSFQGTHIYPFDQ